MVMNFQVAQKAKNFLSNFESISSLRRDLHHRFPFFSSLTLSGRATSLAVSRRLPTRAVWVQSQVRSFGICGGQSGTGARFIRVLRFPLAIFISPTSLHSSASSSIIRDWYNRPISGRRTKWTQSHPTPVNYNKKILAALPVSQTVYRRIFGE
jgi:hypothetical protein